MVCKTPNVNMLEKKSLINAQFILNAIDKAGFKAGENISICLDVAANELFIENKYAV